MPFTYDPLDFPPLVPPPASGPSSSPHTKANTTSEPSSRKIYTASELQFLMNEGLVTRSPTSPFHCLVLKPRILLPPLHSRVHTKETHKVHSFGTLVTISELEIPLNRDSAEALGFIGFTPQAAAKHFALWWQLRDKLPESRSSLIDFVLEFGTDLFRAANGVAKRQIDRFALAFAAATPAEVKGEEEECRVDSRSDDEDTCSGSKGKGDKFRCDSMVPEEREMRAARAVDSAGPIDSAHIAWTKAMNNVDDWLRFLARFGLNTQMQKDRTADWDIVRLMCRKDKLVTWLKFDLREQYFLLENAGKHADMHWQYRDPEG